MAIRLTAPAPVAAALAALAAALALAWPGEANGAGACKRWGDASPDRLSPRQARKAVHCLVNRERGRRGLPALDRDRRLERAAQRHNRRMDGTGCFAHQCPGEPALDRRLRNAGYLGGGLRSWAYGENVAWGSGRRGTPRAVVAAWMGSSGHRSNILSRSFRELGVGFSAGTPSGKRASGGIYTTDFGRALR